MEAGTGHPKRLKVLRLNILVLAITKPENYMQESMLFVFNVLSFPSAL